MEENDTKDINEDSTSVKKTKKSMKSKSKLKDRYDEKEDKKEAEDMEEIEEITDESVTTPVVDVSHRDSFECEHCGKVFKSEGKSLLSFNTFYFIS